MADFRLARLLTAHPALATSPEEAATVLARAVESGLPDAILLTAMLTPDADKAPAVLLAETMADLSQEQAAELAALAATARFGDAMIGPGWSYLRGAGDQGDGVAAWAFLRVLVFYGPSIWRPRLWQSCPRVRRSA